MEPDAPQNRLSRISTAWYVLEQARSNTDAKRAAQELLIECYGPAVRSYLLKLTGEADVTDDLCQAFMVKLLDGSFANASAEQGRFRSYVKTILFRMVAAEFRNKTRRPGELKHEPTDSESIEFDHHWRENLLERTWLLLEDVQPRYAAALRLRAEYPDHSIEQLLASSNGGLGTANVASFRKLISRARERFALLLLDEVARSIRSPSRSRIEEELASLNLLDRCRAAVDAWSEAGRA
ncbi:MAG: RNA polymerase sigma factor [Planctomycetaceae bacterium]